MSNTNYTVVIGSRPGSVLPAVEPKRVFTASGAAPRALYYREQYGTEIISVIAHGVFVSNNHRVQENVLRTNPDQIVIRCTKNEFQDNDHFLEQFPEEKIHFVSRSEQFAIQRSVVGWRIYIGVLEHSVGFISKMQYFLRRVLLPSLGSRRKPAQGCSAGLWTALYALSRDKDTTVIMAGIGFVAGEHFYPDTLSFSSSMGRIDTWVAKHLPENYRARLFTTDQSAYEIGGINFWEGETTDL